MVAKDERLTASIVSLSFSSLVVWFSLWLVSTARIDFTPGEKMGQGKVIEIVLPDVQEEVVVQRPKEQILPQRREVVKRTSAPPKDLSETKRVVEPQQKTSPPMPQESVVPKELKPVEPVAKEAERAERKEEGGQPQKQEQQGAKRDVGQKEESGQHQRQEQRGAKQDVGQKEVAERTPPPPARREAPQEDDVLVQYFAKIKAIIEKKKRYPDEARRRGIEGVVVVKVAIGEDGSLRAVRLVRSSGNYLLDEESIRAVKSVGKFPAPPGGRPIEFNLEVTYKLGG